ncbi:MAG: hypothetical protein AAB403_00240 [Planctomycetota bacterium]
MAKELDIESAQCLMDRKALQIEEMIKEAIAMARESGNDKTLAVATRKLDQHRRWRARLRGDAQGK